MYEFISKKDLTVTSTIDPADTKLPLEIVRLEPDPSFTGRMVHARGLNRMTKAHRLESHVYGTPEEVASWGLIDNGDGTLRWANIQSGVIGFSVEDRTGMGRFDLAAGYCDIGLQIEGDCEKANIDIRVMGCDQAVRELKTANGTPDSNRINLSGQGARRVFTSGHDCTSMLDLNWEARRDLGLMETLSDGVIVPDPAIMINNGKSSAIQGENRGHNGRLFVLVDHDGSNALDGSDAYHINNFRMTDNCYGTLAWVRRCQRLTGTLYGRNCHDGRLNDLDDGPSDQVGSIPSPSVRIDQVYSGDFNVVIQRCNAREGLRIGDAVNDYYPRDWNMGANTIIMEGFNPRIGVYPVNRNALVIERMEGGAVPFTQIEGRIKLGAGCQNVDIYVQESWNNRYGVDAEVGAKYRVMTHDGNVVASAV